MTSSTTAAQKRAAAKKAEEVDPFFLETRVIENNLHADTAAGEVVLPLSLKTKVFRQMRDSGLDGLDQIETFVLKPIPGGQKIIDTLEDLELSVTMTIVNDWYAAITERQGASLGESSGSQTS